MHHLKTPHSRKAYHTVTKFSSVWVLEEHPVQTMLHTSSSNSHILYSPFIAVQNLLYTVYEYSSKLK